jgi:hypothetical protein
MAYTIFKKAEAKMNQSEMRQIAIGATRSQLRRLNIDPRKASSDDALEALDDIYRVEPELIASLWYGNASDNQIRLFRREWEKWLKPQ